MNRRTVLAGVGSIGLASLAGCLGLAGLDKHESDPAGVDAAVRDDTGYEQTKIDDLVIDEKFELGPYSETVSVTNYLTEHEKRVDMGPLGSQRGALFMVLTTPQVSIAGRELNPVGDMSTTELVDLVQSNYDAIGDIAHDGNDEIAVLDQETTISRFTADAQFNGQDVEVYLHVTEAVETAEDLLVTIGVYPSLVRSQEEDNVLELVSNVTETVDESASTGGAEGSGEGNGGNESDSGNESDGGILDAV
ncbi:DUF6517 family protein [Halosolutus gelatinilyticus]|uniref:DUF6517 family protein n=1 Tax=Halosolutus gelatinilyticus TaxID=2931975 RepID=UPI001FF3AFB8|nr:DUF6517 family protein [Halosolutus gelatinilyticus]